MMESLFELPGRLTDTPEWAARLVIASVVVFALGKVVRWLERMFRRATFFGLIGMIIFGWDAPSAQKDDDGPLSDVAGDPVGFRDVEALQCGGSGWPPHLSVAVRWSVLAMFGFMIAAPMHRGLPLPFEALSVGALALFLVSDLSIMLNRPGSFSTYGARMRVGFAGLLLVMLGATGMATNTGASDLMWSGLSIIGLCMLIASVGNRTSLSIRVLGAAGWLLCSVGVPFVYDGLLTDPAGVTIVFITSMANGHATYRSLRTSRLFATAK